MTIICLKGQQSDIRELSAKLRFEWCRILSDEKMSSRFLVQIICIKLDIITMGRMESVSLDR